MLAALRRSQSLWVALVVLGMTATVAFAGAGGVPGSSHSAWNRAGADASEAPDESEAPDASEAPDGSEAPDSADTTTNDTAVNHGALVSVAANMDTPDGFANHGAFVSCVAHMAHDVDPATFDWTTVTPESCGYVTDGADQASVNGHGHGWGRSKTHHGGNPN